MNRQQFLLENENPENPLDNPETYHSYEAIIQNAVNYGFTVMNVSGYQQDERENAAQDCWVSILEFYAKYGHLPDFALAKKIARNDVIDFLRSKYREAPTTVDAPAKYRSDDEEYTPELADEDPMFDPITATEADFDTAEIINLLNYFDKGSKEQEYLKLKLQQAGIKDYGIEVPKTRTNDGYTDSFYAVHLGFKGTDDGAWKRFRQKMEDTINLYFGTNKSKDTYVNVGAKNQKANNG